jgi:hypothetical protein
VFAACSPRQLRRIGRWGDLIQVDTGQLLVRQDHSDWWFFVIVSGRVALTADGARVDELTPGEHFGETAIIGLRPQPVTATALEPTVLFVLGPRYVLSLLSASAGFRRTVAPDVDEDEFAAYAQRMHDEGQSEWQRLAVAHRTVAAPVVAAQAARQGTPQRDRPPGRPLSLAEAVAALAQLPPGLERPASSPLPAIGPRWWFAGAAVVPGVLAAVLFAYHPPRLVLTAGRPIDVVGEIQVSGAPTYPPSGHYLLLWVRASQPNLFGYLTARMQGRTTVPLDRADGIGEREAGRQQYLDSQRTAIRLALTDAGLDRRRVIVHIRDRGFLGPSAGLAYALALEDLLTPGDLVTGRQVGVTGALLTDGRVAPIGWVLIKAHGASADRATLLVVPAGEATAAVDRLVHACGVTNLRDAVRVLTTGC